MPRSCAPILVLDDSPADRDLIRRALMPAAPRRPLIDFDDPEATLQWLLSQGKRANWNGTLLLDWQLAARCCIEVIVAVRSEPRLAGAEIIVLSNLASPEERARAAAAGADAWICKPADWDGYEQLARGIAGTGKLSPAESWRGFGGMASRGELAVIERGLESATQSAPVMIEATAMPHQPMSDPGIFIKLMEYFREQTLATLDPVDVAINELCRKHRIPVRHARGGPQDQVTVANRHAVICGLFDLGFGDRVVLENFDVSQRQVERLRADWRAKGGGSLAVAAR